MKNFFVRDHGYEETLQKALLAARTLGRTLSRGRGTKKECIDRLRKDIDGADAIVLEAGAGLSTSAGLTYPGERFHKYFFDFEETYGIEDMYAGGFYPFPEEEIQWAWWARHSYFNRYVDPPKPVYSLLYTLLKEKNYFILTTNVDHQFQRAEFDRGRLFYTRGIMVSSKM